VPPLLTAEDPEVAAVVMATPGVSGLVGALIALAHSFRRGPGGAQAVIAVGCAGGRHRAPAIAAEVARRLERHGVPVALVHRDISAPVIERPALALAAGGAS
jgi:RNase adaptor protein for sRNA GlmZ degradation